MHCTAHSAQLYFKMNKANALIFNFLFLLLSCDNKTETIPQLTTANDSISYSLGLWIADQAYTNVNKSMLSLNDTLIVNGFTDQFHNKEKAISLEDARVYIKQFTDKLTNKYDAVKFAKLGSETVGGKGGGGRPDFAQAGGVDQSKIDEAFNKLKFLV